MANDGSIFLQTANPARLQQQEAVVTWKTATGNRLAP